MCRAFLCVCRALCGGSAARFLLRCPVAPAGGSLPKRLIDLYFTIFKMILDGKIGTAAQVSRVRQCSRGECVCGACGCCHGSSPPWLAKWRRPAAALPRPRARCWAALPCAGVHVPARFHTRLSPPSTNTQPHVSPNSHPTHTRSALVLPARQLSKAQQDKAAAEAARKKKGEAAKARAAEAARQKAVEAAAAGKDQTGEMDGRMLSALITGRRCADCLKCSVAGACGQNPPPHPHQLPARVHDCAAAEQRRPAAWSGG